MVRRISAVVALLVALSARSALAGAGGGGPVLDGPWHGAIELPGARLKIRVVFSAAAAGLSATIDIPQQGASAIPLRSVVREGSSVRFELPAGPTTAVFRGTLEGDALRGDFTQGAVTGTFALARGEEAAAPAPAPLPYRSQEMTFSNGAVTLAGTLTLPEGKGPFPGVVLLTGSGPQNRDVELFGFKVFAVIADHLSRHGVAVLRFDDRGVGQSTGGDSDPTAEDFAGDALAALARLAAQPELDRSRIGLLGHSEGAAVAAIAAARSEEVKFVVLVAGTAVPGARVLRMQAEDSARAGGATEDQVKAILSAHAAMLDGVRDGLDATKLEARVKALINAQFDALPEQARSKLPDRDSWLSAVLKAQMPGIRSRWMKSFIELDPAAFLAQVHCPALALYGGKDRQVPEALNRPPLEAALAKAGNGQITLKSYPAANHLFIAATTGSPAEYATLEKTFVPGFLDDLSGWILARKSPVKVAPGH